MKFIGFVGFAFCCLLVLPLSSTAASTAPAFQLSDLQIAAPARAGCP